MLSTGSLLHFLSIICNNWKSKRKVSYRITYNEDDYYIDEKYHLTNGYNWGGDLSTSKINKYEWINGSR